MIRKPPLGLFITGTNTEVGKTIVTAGLLRHLRARGLDVVPMKPVQTGGVPGPEGLAAPDLEVHLKAAGMTIGPDDRALISPYVYEPACSPHLAGRMAGAYPSIDHCCACARKLGEAHDGVLIEGAGGLLVPLDEDETLLSLIIQLEVPVLIVAHIGLGTVNHSLLTIDALREAEVPIAGVIFNAPAPGTGEDFIAKDNPDAVARFGGVDILGNVPWLGDMDNGADAAWTRFEEAVPGLGMIASFFSPELPAVAGQAQPRPLR